MGDRSWRPDRLRLQPELSGRPGCHCSAWRQRPGAPACWCSVQPTKHSPWSPTHPSRTGTISTLLLFFFIGLWLVSLSLLVLTFLLLSLFWSLPVFLTIITIIIIIFILMTILFQGRPDLNLFNLFGR